MQVHVNWASSSLINPYSNCIIQIAALFSTGPDLVGGCGGCIYTVQVATNHGNLN